MESIFAVADVFWVAHLGAERVATVGLDRVDADDDLHGRDGAVDRRDGAGVAAHRPERSRRRVARRGAVDPARHASSRRSSRSLAAPRAADLLRLMGASPDVIASGSGFTRVMLGGNVDRHAAVPDQRRLPRRRRRGDRDARAVARQRAQHRARAVLHLRARPVSRAGRRRRGGGDEHRPRQRRHLSAGRRSCAAAGACGCAGAPRGSTCR